MKCELHRHFGGSISANTVFEILKRQRRGTYFTVGEVAKDITEAPTEKHTFLSFLDKFAVLDTIDWDEWAIQHAIKQVSWDIAKEGIDYVEIKLTLDKYLKNPKWDVVSIAKFISDCFREQASRWAFYPALVLALRYDTPYEKQREIASHITNPVFQDCFVGLDLVGDERAYNVEIYEPIFKEWKQAGKGLEAHVGESQGAENVRTAIERLGVTRIAHGIKAADHPDILKLANERGICFDVALTSNIDTGVVASYDVHPILRMLDAGCAITIGTDDPVTLSTTLDQEYEKLQHYFRLSDEQIIQIMYNSYKYAFVDLNTIKK